MNDHSRTRSRWLHSASVLGAAALMWACGGSVSSLPAGTGGAAGAPDWPGTGGTHGSAGAPGTGGTPGSAGATGTGGSTGVGGAPGTAGGPGTGGSPGVNPFVCNGKSMEVPLHHRAVGTVCPTDPAPTCDAGTGCYPTCKSDGDCAAGSDCSCDGTAFGWSHQSLGNVCLPGNCRTDADCGSGYCSPTDDFNSGPFYGTAGFYCHTCADTCINDSDCPSGGFCAYQATVGHWACSNSFAAG